MVNLHLDYLLGYFIVKSGLRFDQVIKEGDPNALSKLRYRWDLSQKVYQLADEFPCFLWFSVCFHSSVAHSYSRIRGRTFKTTFINLETL